MGKKNTLFAYFTKKPASEKSSTVTPGQSKDDTKGKKQKSSVKPSPPISTPGSASTSSAGDESFKPGDLVWAKLDGYPWWASLVTSHPKSNSHTKKEGRTSFIHVQFFDDPPSRGWVKHKNVKPYAGSDCKEFQRGGIFFSSKPECQNAAQEADKALSMDPEERLKELVVAMDSSTEEEDDEDEETEDMDVDTFDAEMSGSSKENTPAKSSKRKSPKKTRSGRQPQMKRRRIIIHDSDDNQGDDSEDEFKPDEQGSSSSEEDMESDAVDSSEPETGSEVDSPVKAKKRRQDDAAVKNDKPSKSLKSNLSASLSGRGTPVRNGTKSPSNGFTPSVGERTISKLAQFSAPDTPTPAPTEDGRVFPHLTEEFLKPEKIRDAERRRPDDPDYDPKTLHVPDAFLNKQTPALRQWWVMKSKHFDTILFFKMGKFYELFNMDAMVAVNELGLIYMKGEHAHAGFPEIAYGRYAETLIQKGYKVARIEQTETPDMMQERVRNMGRSATKYDKVVKRELCSVQTRGTKRYSFIDGDSGDSSHAYLLAIKEREGLSEAGGASAFGVCFIDTSIGKFHIGQFDDDRHNSRLTTLISHYPPAQVLYERGHISEKLQSLLHRQLVSTMKDGLRSGSEFWEAPQTLKVLSESNYFSDNKESTQKLPDAIQAMVSDTDTLGLTPKDGCDLALSAFGAVIWYLTSSLMDYELLSMGKFERYSPLDSAQPAVAMPQFTLKKMVLDSVTLANLEVLENSTDGSLDGTLLQYLNHCVTPFGKRLFKQWLCAPSCQYSAINDRLDAVEDLMNHPDLTAEAAELLRKLPDLERLLSKIHTLGLAKRSAEHPDGRAIFFEDVAYSKRKIEDFLSTLSGYSLGMKIAQKFKQKIKSFKSKLLIKTVGIKGEECSDGRFPDLTAELDFFEKSFDHKKAKSEGIIKPNKGVDVDYDLALEDLKLIQQQLNDYLDKQRSRLGCRSIVYWGTAKNRFQMEIPEAVAKKVPNEYELTSSKKGHKRYRTREIEKLLNQMIDAEERRDAALRDVMRRIFAQFDAHYDSWVSAVECLSVLDVLMSLSEVSKSTDGVMSRPELHQPTDDGAPFIEIREGRHPCISRTFTGGDFIPNDTFIGIKNEDDESEEGNSSGRLVLVTGPNMGGKSTLMRQVGCIVIMAHLGCYVPAEKCSLSIVDRVFTRLGASDRIMAGESTFFVELSETSAILQHATKHSLVLLDELGRGTATYDGTAIACAVVQELSQNIGCRTLFSTHYHSLVEEFSHDSNIRLGHMACMVENENEDDPSEETITFLYKFVSGACPKSYGFNAARLAGLPQEVINCAMKKSKDFEASIEGLTKFRKIFQLSSEQKSSLSQLIN